ncbi:penicillin-binding protein activator [Roseomonas sp. CCTCC AB2023176]|uniref:penicillin-binding protein activator n=1 Tax=Roseomonas sp. CCTCC AB2023176 TaxID=3342640 RepID=UPI0035DD9D65
MRCPDQPAQPLPRRLARRLLPAVLVLLGLAACAPQPARPVASFGAPGFVEPPRARVGLLLPLTGPQAPLGQAMLNAATLALFDAGTPGVEFVPRDTGGSPGIASEAARIALADGARIIVGPLTAAEATAVSAQARGGRVPVLAFTNDGQLAGNGTWVLGVTPAQQVRRLVLAARNAGVRRIALAAPEDAFGQRLASALRTAAPEAGLDPPVIVTYPAGSPRAAAASQVASQGGEGLGLVIIGESNGARARELASALAAAGLRAPATRFAGSALWAADPSIGTEAALAGAIFPGPDPGARSGFEGRYQAAFGERPPRLAATAYDAAIIAARAASGGPSAPLRLPVGEGVPGADGGLRLLPNGEVQRALAIYAVEPGAEPRPVEAAILPGAAGT